MIAREKRENKHRKPGWKQRQKARSYGIPGPGAIEIP
jgi:hypothetical protein